jgi:hypothetical protein
MSNILKFWPKNEVEEIREELLKRTNFRLKLLDKNSILNKAVFEFGNRFNDL